jgi:hypothetical protein
MECAAICYAAAQVISMGGQKQPNYAEHMQTFARPVQMSAVSMRTATAKNAQRLAEDVQRNAGEW